MNNDQLIVHGKFLDNVGSHPVAASLGCLAVLAILVYLVLRTARPRSRSSDDSPPTQHP